MRPGKRESQMATPKKSVGNSVVKEGGFSGGNLDVRCMVARLASAVCNKEWVDEAKGVCSAHRLCSLALRCAC